MILKLYVHYDIDYVRFIVVTKVEQRLLPSTAWKKEQYGSNTCYIPYGDVVTSKILDLYQINPVPSLEFAKRKLKIIQSKLK